MDHLTISNKGDSIFIVSHSQAASPKCVNMVDDKSCCSFYRIMVLILEPHRVDRSPTQRITHSNVSISCCFIKEMKGQKYPLSENDLVDVIIIDFVTIKCHRFILGVFHSKLYINRRLFKFLGDQQFSVLSKKCYKVTVLLKKGLSYLSLLFPRNQTVLTK